MPAISLTDFASQQAEIARREKMADLLAQQGQQDIPIQSYNGIQAPIPWTAVLAKAMASGLSAYQSKKLADETTGLRQHEKDTFDKLSAQMYGSPTETTTAPATNAPVPIRNDDYAAMAAQGPPPPGPTPQAMAQALGGPPPSAPPVAMPPPQGAPPPQAGPPPEAPMGIPGDNGPPMAPPMAPPPQAAPPVAPPAPPNPIEARLAVARSNLQKALGVQSQFVGTPYAPQAAAMVKSAQEQLQKIGDLQDTAAAKEAERVAQVTRTTAFVQQLPGLSPEVKATLAAGAASDPKLASTISAKMVADAFVHQLVPATPEDLAGYPKGTIAQKDPKTNKLENIYNPIPNLMAIANERDRRQEIGISGANLAMRRAEFNRDNLSAPTTIEHVVNGEPVQTTAMFDKKHGRYVDMTGNAVDPTGLRVMPAGSSRATLGLLRVATAAADAVTGIENLSKLPAGSNMGWFSQAANTPLGGLKRVLTPQEAQDMRATAAGLSRAMGGLATGGLAVDIPTQQSYEALIPQAGQTRLTALRQMGEMRQQAVNGIESALANPYITPAQKANLTAAKTKIESAVPWSPNDVSALETTKNPNATMHGMGIGKLKPTAHDPALMSAADAALAKLGIH